MNIARADCDGALPPLVMKGIEEFNRGEFYEQHETLEIAWRAEPRPVRRLYQAILQIGVACYHLERGNRAGALRLLERGLRKLRPFAPACLGIGVERLIADAERLQGQIQSAGPDHLVKLDRALFPRIILIDSIDKSPLPTQRVAPRRLAERLHMDFEGKLALITGSGRGIGRAIALHFAQRGADIVVNFFRNRQPAKETAAQVTKLGRKAIVVKADVGEPDGIERLFAETERAFGGLDILVCNAASGYNRPVMEQRIKGWDWTMNINARAALFCAQKAVPLMQKRGRGYIVNVSSIGSHRVLPDYVVVGASKAALEAVTRYLAIELAPLGIVVNAVSGGVVETEALKHFRIMQDGGLLAHGAERTPAGRMVTPEDMASAVAFLCTPEAEMIRGQVIVVDGGYTLVVR